MRGCRGLTGVGLSSGRRCIIGRARARLVLSVQVLVPSSARGESRTLTGLPPGDFESPASAIPPLGRATRELSASTLPAAPCRPDEHLASAGVSSVTAL